MNPELSRIAWEVRGWIEASLAHGVPAASFDDVAARLLALQRRFNPAFAAWCAAARNPPPSGAPAEAYPAVPTEAFKHAVFSCIPEGAHAVEFQSSGTTVQVPSRHRHHAESLSLYTLSALRGFERHVLANRAQPNDSGGNHCGPRPRMLSLTPSAAHAPRSSLVHMLDAVLGAHGGDGSCFLGRRAPDGTWELDVDGAMEALHGATALGLPVFVLGTAFNWVHLLDGMDARGAAIRLPPGSRVMETGGYKGRSRTLTREALHVAIAERLGMPRPAIVTEYGMTELSSQAYDRVAWPLDGGTGEGGTFRFLPWARARVVSPETGREVAEGETGIVEVLDVANVWSVAAIRTSDLAVRRADGFELAGRAASAEPRGCSRMSA